MTKKQAMEIKIIIAPAADGHVRNTEASILPFDDGRLLMA